jgi:hypothetical protein
LRLPCGTCTESGPPEYPLATCVFGVGQSDVTAEVPIGFVVLHDRLTLQLLAPAAIVHDVADKVSEPVVGKDSAFTTYVTVTFTGVASRPAIFTVAVKVSGLKAEVTGTRVSVAGVVFVPSVALSQFEAP